MKLLILLFIALAAALGLFISVGIALAQEPDNAPTAAAWIEQTCVPAGLAERCSIEGGCGMVSRDWLQHELMKAFAAGIERGKQPS